jgi:hypothetical protein
LSEYVDIKMLKKDGSMDEENTKTLIEALDMAFNSAKALREKERQDEINEQELRDKKSLEMAKRNIGGGTITLESNNNMIYPSIYEGISDLYSRSAKGDTKAQKQIEQLWNKPNVKRELSRMEKEGITIQSCPNCNYPLTEYLEYCPNCNADLRKLFEHRERVY